MQNPFCTNLGKAKSNMPKLLLISHLRLGQKSVQVGEPETLAKSGGNAWAALRTAHASVGSEPLTSFLVGEEGLEPSRCCHHRILSPARLPFRHSPAGHMMLQYILEVRHMNWLVRNWRSLQIIELAGMVLLEI